MRHPVGRERAAMKPTINTKFTPGPWEADIDRGVLVHPQPGRYSDDFAYHDVAEIAEVHSWVGAEEADANVFLITAAPELYEALEALKRGDNCWCQMAIGNHSNACKQAQAALAKARGEL